jgi:hypothetical protein
LFGASHPHASATATAITTAAAKITASVLVSCHISLSYLRVLAIRRKPFAGQ